MTIAYDLLAAQSGLSYSSSRGSLFSNTRGDTELMREITMEMTTQFRAQFLQWFLCVVCLLAVCFALNINKQNFLVNGTTINYVRT